MKSEKNIRSYMRWLGILALVFAAAIALGGNVMTVNADDGEPGWKGLIESRPENPTDDVWVINEKSFIVDEATVLEGDLLVGSCVEVEYQETDAGLLALKIKADDDCDDGKGDDEQKWKGLIESRPENPTDDIWVINEKSFIVDEATVLEGDLLVGSCVEVEYQETDAGLLALKIKTDDDCDDKKGDDRDDHYGRIDALPEEGVNDTWIIDGVEYMQTDTTKLETEYGDFEVGVCVEFEVDEEDPTILTKVETERDHKCKDKDKEHPEGVIFGVVTVAPDGLIGEWAVGDHVFVSDESTKFKLQHGPAEVGVTVKIKFYIDDEGVNRALEIQSKYMKEKDEDDNGDGFRQGIEGKVYGVIQEFPDGKTGPWLVSGVTYMATEDTEFEEDDGVFAIGAQVKVEYIVSEDGTLIAKEIETTDDDGGVDADNQFKLVGFVDDMPETGFNGNWIISGAEFVGINATVYAESNGLLVDGAYVQVTYEIFDNARQMVRIQTEVPPGAGETDDTGAIENIGGDTLAAASIDAATSVWRIDGVDYLVSPATYLNDASGALTVGNTVMVNSYVDGSGNNVATRVQGVTLEPSVYLPFTVSR